MEAPGMTAPVESLIAPRMVAVGNWDIASFATVKREKHNTATWSVFERRQYRTIGHLPFLDLVNSWANIRLPQRKCQLRQCQLCQLWQLDESRKRAYSLTNY